MRTSLSLLALFLVVALALVTPADCGCRVDLHGGEPLHPVFAHEHPSAPTATDRLAAAPSSQPQLTGAVGLASLSPMVIAGQVLPRPIEAPEPGQPVAWLTRSLGARPSSLGNAPPDPPPERA